MRTIIQPLVVNSQQLIVAYESNIIGDMQNNEEKVLFSKRLNNLCEEKGLPLHGRQTIIKYHFLSLGIRISQESVRKWLMAESIPRHEKKIILCKYFNVLYEWLSTGKGDKRLEVINAAREIFETNNTKKQDLIKFILSLPDDEVDEQRVTLIKYSGLIDKRFIDGSARILHEIAQPERKYDAQKTEESKKEGNGE